MSEIEKDLKKLDLGKEKAWIKKQFVTKNNEISLRNPNNQF